MFSFADTEPALRYKVLTTGTWGSGGNTLTITSEKISTNSYLVIWVTGTTPAAGRWAITCNQGNAVVTSSSSENSALPIAYFVI
jgi:hypothetical protein